MEKKKFDIVQSHERISGCDIYRAGDGVHRRWLLQVSRVIPSWKRKILMRDRYHLYLMNSEQKIYESSELKAIICNSEMIKREIIEDYFVDQKKIHVIYNSIDSNRFVPTNFINRSLLRRKIGLPTNATVFCFVGSGFRRKGLATAIQVIKGTPNYLIVIGKDKSEKYYRELANSLGCQKQIRFLGIQKEVLPFYQMSDGLLLPTLYDPFPNVILEAMSCGLPVITSNSCGGSELIEQGKNGFFCDPLNIKMLKEAVMATFSLTKNDKMGKKSRSKVKKLTSEQLANKLISLYQSILN